MADYEIPVFGQLAPKADINPAPVAPRQKGTWALTPSGMYGKEWCAGFADTLRKRGVNALILTEDGKLEFGVVERDDALRHDLERAIKNHSADLNK